MYYKQALKPNELLPALSDSGECFFIIRAALFNQISSISRERQGDEEQILPFIEEALEDNHYFLVEKEFIRLDLLTLQKMTTIQSFEILFYEFFDF